MSDDHECQSWQHGAIRWGLEDLQGRCIDCKESITENRQGVVLRQTLGHGREDMYAAVAFIVCEECADGDDPQGSLIRRIAKLGHAIYSGDSRGVTVETS